MAGTLVVALQGELQNQTMDLIAGAYETISVRKASQLLGISEGDTTQRCGAAGWQLDNGMLAPVRPERPKAESVSTENLKALTDYMTAMDA